MRHQTTKAGGADEVQVMLKNTFELEKKSHYILDQYNLEGDDSYKREFQVLDLLLLDRLRGRTKNVSVFSS